MPQIETKNPKLKVLKGLHLWHAPMSSCSQRVRIVLAETGRGFESHVVNLERDEHATPEYQAIHPKGLVPALVDDGRLFIESVDIITHLGGEALTQPAQPDLLKMADQAQLDLKLLTFEFLFRALPPPPTDAVENFEQSHRNEWLLQFRRDFASGFDRDRLNDAIARTDAGFRHLDRLLSDGRRYLEGDEFTISDIAWMPNVHRFQLMNWPFERTKNLQNWMHRVTERPSYAKALLDWQDRALIDALKGYVAKRRSEGTDIRSFPHFDDGTQE